MNLEVYHLVITIHKIKWYHKTSELLAIGVKIILTLHPGYTNLCITDFAFVELQFLLCEHFLREIFPLAKFENIIN